MKTKAKLLLIIGPTAVGKSSIIEKALEDFPQLVDLITYTTRKMRAGEFEGNPYHFVSEEKFRELMAKGFFLETANVHGNLYGTPRDQVDIAAAEGKCVIADVDVQGAKKLIEIYPEAVTVFLMPPSIEALRERFIKRGITSEEDLAKRLDSARRELAQSKDFNHLIVNDRLDSAYEEVCGVIKKLVGH
jgi:guanylate kinase